MDLMRLDLGVVHESNYRWEIMSGGGGRVLALLFVEPRSFSGVCMVALVQEGVEAILAVEAA